jgi:tRNA(Ile)-lysidine synthase
MPTPSARAPAAADDPVEQAAFAALDRRLAPSSTAPIALALSGGGDSVALLVLAARWAGARGRPLAALTVDHGLNPDSRAWSAFARAAAARHGAGWAGLEWRGDKPAAGLPAAARAARHALLAEAARRIGARVLLTAHTAGDVAEGEAMRERDVPALGALREWSPSPAWPEGRGLLLLRPLLGIGREAVRDWLRAQGETWIDDPANTDLRFARSRARLRLRSEPSPLAGEGGAHAPAWEGEGSRDAKGMGRRDPSPSRPADGPLPLPQGERGWTVTPDGRVVLPRQGIGARTLSAALLCAAGTDAPPRGAQVERLLDRLAGDAPVDATLAGARLVAAGERVEIGRDAGERFRGALEPTALRPAEPVVWDGRFEVAAEAEGLTIQPLGGVIARLTPRDRARIKTVPPWARGALPALVSPDLAVSLPRPLGEGPAAASPLAAPRLAAALGLVTGESEAGEAPHGAGGFSTLC